LRGLHWSRLFYACDKIWALSAMRPVWRRVLVG
jgi:hypothetical protein